MVGGGGGGGGPSRLTPVPGRSALQQAAAASDTQQQPRLGPAPLPGSDVGPDLAEQHLLLFRQEFYHSTPFVEILPADTAASLRQRAPALFAAIIFATSYHDRARQRQLAKDFIVYVTEQMFQHGQRSMSLLQGLLVFTNW